jgi:multidrug efflux pump subunit AcrA (membrane-fusion protein)
MYARVRFPKGPPRERLVLPVEAVMSGQQGRYVSIVEPKDPATDPKAPPPPEGYRVGLVSPFRTVTTGFQTDDQQLPIEKGKLAASDLVVVHGVQKARPGSYVFYQVQDDSAAAKTATPAHK